MEVTKTAGSAADSIKSRIADDRKELRDIGKELKSSEGRYRTAIKGGDEGAIAEAQMDYEKSAQKLKARLELNSAINRLINSIIEKIGQIGR